jgi:hypothetical protein
MTSIFISYSRRDKAVADYEGASRLSYDKFLRLEKRTQDLTIN